MFYFNAITSDRSFNLLNVDAEPINTDTDRVVIDLLFLIYIIFFYTSYFKSMKKLYPK